MVRLRTAVPLIAAAMLGAGGPVLAQPATLRDMLERRDERRSAAPIVARYSFGADAGFVLDRSQRNALLKFDDRPEVWVLYPSPAPRGDILYRNDAGAVVIRATKLGGLILFTPSMPGGAPAAMEGEASELRLPAALSASALLQKLAQASIHATGAAKRLVPFEATGVTPGEESIFADAAAVTAEAIVNLSHTAAGRAAIARFRKVRLTPGRKAGAEVRGGVMQVVVVPEQGLAGRPSSDRLMQIAQAAK